MTFSDIRYTTYTGSDPQPGFVSLYVDSAADLPTVAAVQIAGNVDPLPGSTCVTCDTGQIYLLDSLGSWHAKQGETFSNVYTQAEVDALLAGKQDTLTITGTASAGSTDIITAGGAWKETYMQHTLGFAANSYDDYNTPGRWLVSASASYTIARRPAYFASSAQQAACTLEVVQVYESGSSYRLLQRLWISGARYFMRGYLSTRTPDPWFDWYMYEGTVQGYLP